MIELSRVQTHFFTIYLLATVCQAAVMRVSTTTSTGMTSMWHFSSQMMVLMVPRPHSMKMPVMPLMLSTQPGYGSFQAAVTGMTIIIAVCVIFVMWLDSGYVTVSGSKP